MMWMMRMVQMVQMVRVMRVMRMPGSTMLMVGCHDAVAPESGAGWRREWCEQERDGRMLWEDGCAAGRNGKWLLLAPCAALRPGESW